MKLRIQALLAGVVLATSFIGVAQAQEKAPASSGSETVQVKINAPSSIGPRKAARIAQAELNKLGTPHIKNGLLYIGNVRVNGNRALVDEITNKTGYLTTIGAKDGNKFVRVATNLREHGKRAVGTLLAFDSPGYAAVSKGRSYYGNAMTLGKEYVSAVVPLRNASGNVIGYFSVRKPV